MRWTGLWSVGALGCSDAKTGTPSTDSAPTRVDGDADADADSDTEEPTGTMSGTVALDRTKDTLPDCHAVITLAGAAYVGDCPSCAFAFDIDATPVDTDCGLPSWLSFVDDPVYFDTKLAFGASVETTSGEQLTNALLFGTSYDLTSYGIGVYPGPYWSVLRSDGDPDVFTFDGTSLAWSWPSTYDVGVGETPYRFYDPASCPNPYTYGAYRPGAVVEGVASAEGDVDCYGLYTDVHLFDAAAGDLVAISVDTVASETAFDPVVYVSGPDGCVVVSGDENFECTWPPPTAYRCPFASFVAPEAGQYRVSVLAYSFGGGDHSSCAGPVGAYDLQVDGPTVAALTLLGDDLPFYEEISQVDLEYSLSATLLPQATP